MNMLSVLTTEDWVAINDNLIAKAGLDPYYIRELENSKKLESGEYRLGFYICVGAKDGKCANIHKLKVGTFKNF